MATRKARLTLPLEGLRREPLASYLSALAVLRLLGEGPDPSAAGKWKHGTFLLSTVLTADEVLDFFLWDYSPTPMVSPWNGGSGFYENDNSDGVEALLASQAPRFRAYRETLRTVSCYLASQRITVKPRGNDKVELFKGLRSVLGDEALRWLDAVLVLGEQDSKGRTWVSYAPSLGSGGNDARLEFSNNFMQRLEELFLCDEAEPERNAQLLRATLFGERARPLQRCSMGQFDPGAAGGPNSTVGFEGPALVNPWSYLLALEGSLMLAAGAARRYRGTSRAGSAFPFTVIHLGAGHGKLAPAEGNRHEIWLPIWEDKFVGLVELEQRLAQGWAQLRSQQVRNPVEFALALTSGGTSRGWTGFTRFGFLQRNGQSYFANPLGYYPVGARDGAYDLARLEQWFGRHREALYSYSPVSNRLAVGCDCAVLDYLKNGEPRSFTRVLEKLGELNRFLAGEFKLQEQVRPIKRLRKSWVRRGLEDSPEFRLALALSTLGGTLPDPRLRIRGQLEPCGPFGRQWRAETFVASWVGRDLSERMLNLLCHRLRSAESVLPHFRRQPIPRFRDSLWSPNRARLSDIELFLEGRLDEERLERLLYGLILVEPAVHGIPPGKGQAFLGLPYSLPKLAMSQGFPMEAYDGSHHEAPPREEMRDRRAQPRQLPRLLAAGKLQRALRLARQHLLGRPLRVPASAVIELALPRDQARRLAASLLFPISDFDYRDLAQTILQLPTLDPETDTAYVQRT